MCGTYGGSSANQISGRAVRSGVGRGVGRGVRLGAGLVAAGGGVGAGGGGVGAGAPHAPRGKAAATITWRNGRGAGNLTELLRLSDGDAQQGGIAAGIRSGVDHEIERGPGA